MKKILFVLFVLAFVLVGEAAGAVVPRVYGLRVYSESGLPQALVSFPADKPEALVEELDMSDYPVRSAVFAGGQYYMITSDDGYTASKMYAMDMASKKIRLVKEYDYKYDRAGNILVVDMAFDEITKQVYAIGYDLTDADVVGGDIDAKFGLYSVNVETGEFVSIGTQNTMPFVAIAFDRDGCLFGITDKGALWEINVRTSRPMDEYHTTGILPSGLQGMATDSSTGKMYWASFSVVDAEAKKGASQLVEISFTEDGFCSHSIKGNIKDNAELIGLYVDPDPVSDGAPAVPEAFAVAPAAEGATSATLSWVNPARTVGGSELASVDIKIFRNGECVETFAGRKPGEKDSYVDKVESSGLVEYSICGVAGEEQGRAAYSDIVYVGVDRPGAPVSPAAVRTGSGYDIRVSWEAPVAGAQGGWFDKENVSYKVTRLPDGVVLDPGSKTSIVDNAITEAHGYVYKVSAVTAAGEGTEASTEPCLSGPAVTLPYVMDLQNSDDVNMWSVYDSDKDGYKWYVDNNWAGTYENFFRYYPDSKQGGGLPADDWLVSAPMTVEAGKHYVVKYQIRLLGYLYPVDYSIFMGKGNTPENMTVELERVEKAVNDIVWEQRAVSFKAEEGGDYSFGFQVKTANPIQLYKVEIREIATLDLAAVNVSGPTSGGVGVVSEYTVTVANEGYSTVDSYVVNLVDENDNVLASKKVDEALASQSVAEVLIEWSPESAGQYTLKARVEAEADGKSDNDLSAGLSVMVLNAGSWRDINDGKSKTSIVPFYLQYKHTTTQTIYTAEEVSLGSSTLEAMRYYYSVLSGNPAPFHARLWLANVSKDDFGDKEFVNPSEFTLVYDGMCAPEAVKTGQLAFVFDKPFVYTGGNLCVMAEQSTENVVPSMMVYDAYKGSAANGDSYRMVLYRNNESPFEYGKPHNGAYYDRVNASFYVTGVSGVEDVATTGDTIDMSYSSSTGELVLSSEASLRVYSLQGALLASFEPSVSFDLSGLSGLVVVEASNKSTRLTRKVRL